MKVDLKKELPTYAAKRGVVDLVEIPPLQYLAIDGHADPNTASAYADALATLYPVTYALKFLSKRELGRDYVVPPLEALWWADDMAAFTAARDKTRWSWTVLSLVPDWLDGTHVEAARAAARSKGCPMLGALRLEPIEEGLCVQTLHVGSYDDEAPTLARLHDEVMPALGVTFNGPHHEIYLSDPRRTAPEKLRTILRQPVARA